jgi:endo-1,4-beta-mannosidase
MLDALIDNTYRLQQILISTIREGAMNRILNGLLPLALFAVVAANQVHANGEIGEHVNDLKAHIEEYTGEVRWFLEQADTIVDTYADKGAAAAEPGKLIEHWEAVKFHSAIETTYVPVYASIWQGIFGIHDAIKQGRPAAEAREQLAALEQAMWQALGAVKLAAKNQAEQPVAATSTDPMDPVSTLGQIKDNLDRVVAKYAERDLDTALDLVHDTYADRFEGVEGPLIEHDAALVEDLEKDFNVILPKQLQGSASVQEVEQTVNSMKTKIERAQSLLADAAKNRRSVF